MCDNIEHLNLRDSEFTQEQIHKMCTYLKADEQCQKCPRTVQTIYGPCTQMCWLLAEENLKVTKEILGR